MESFRRWPLWLVFAAVIFFTLVSADGRATPAFTRAVLLHENTGSLVRFLAPNGTRSVSLQGWVPRAKKWVQLSARLSPQPGENTLRIPRAWRERSLRVIAKMRAGESSRTPVEFRLVDEGRALTFVASHPGARLYSIEVANEDTSGWQRVSTVAAPADNPTALRVPLPSSLPSGARLRVLAVSGAGSGGLIHPLSSRLGRGPVAYGGSSAFGELVSMLASISGGEAASNRSSGAAAGEDAAPDVNQSDIWSIRGARIYFFNQLRGLQVLDVADRSNPLLKGQLSLPAVGEEMYLLGGDENAAASAVLLVRAGQAREPDFTRVLRIDLAGDHPSPQSEMEIPGYFIESRLAGTTLHVVTAAWENNGGEWRPRTWVTSLDLSSSSAVVQTGQIAFDFLAAQVGATARYLWMSGPDANDWSRHRLYAFPFRVDGSLAGARSARLGGVVLDKFKVGDVAGGLAAVVQSWRSPEGQWQQVTAVETLADDGVVALAPRSRLELIRDESLFASRFDGSRLYAVTFRLVDPLWLVDLSDPSAPAIVSELEVPGWSSFIEPMGDVLVAIGREDGRVQISLFDVADPSAPALAQRIYLGSASSWSEAEWDERALRILRDDGLILLPVTEIKGSTSSEKVALVEFNLAQRTLRTRGTINHAFPPRRAALLDSTAIASVSNRELLVIDATDRDNPHLSAQIPLAFGSEFVAAKDGLVYQVESGRHGLPGDGGRAVLRVSPVSATAEVVRSIGLERTAVAGAAVFGDRLCIVEYDRPDPVLGDWTADESSGALLSVWSVADAPAPMLLDRIALATDARGRVDLLEVAGGKIAVVDRPLDHKWFLRPMPMLEPGVVTSLSVIPAIAVFAESRIGLPWTGWNRGSLTVDIVDLAADSPRLTGSWSLSGDDVSEFSAVYAAGDLLVLSFVRSTSGDDFLAGAAAGVGAGKVVAPLQWSVPVRRTLLQILDLADPAAPMPWAPVEIPGDLVGVSWLQRTGGVLFTTSGEAQDRVAALGFDGERASLVAEVEVGSGPVASSGRSVFAGHQGGVREWNFSEEKASWQAGSGWSFSTGDGIDGLHPMDGALLASGIGTAWALLEDGSIFSASTAGPGQIHRAAQSGEVFLVPAGDYGILSLTAP